MRLWATRHQPMLARADSGPKDDTQILNVGGTCTEESTGALPLQAVAKPEYSGASP